MKRLAILLAFLGLVVSACRGSRETLDIAKLVRDVTPVLGSEESSALLRERGEGVVVAVPATACAPCLAEAEGFAAAARDLDLPAFVFVSEVDPDRARRFAMAAAFEADVFSAREGAEAGFLTWRGRNLPQQVVVIADDGVVCGRLPLPNRVSSPAERTALLESVIVGDEESPNYKCAG